ncbi:unnamed protein product [Heligmosomoides polygyrus]|uniref:Transmembrane protein n=1 Tax=Heligmosomoides polygyrus TaxID=6339 RepID=A0A183G6G5_HELPZ|nr:unnamed protein product [Heligmosomoides polygyrus]
MRVGDRPITGWKDVSSSSFHGTVIVVAIAANELRDAALWLYVSAWYSCVVGKFYYNVITTLNFDTSTKQLPRNTAEWRLVVTIRVGPPDNFLMMTVFQNGQSARPHQVAPHILKAITVQTWNDCPLASDLVDPGADEWYHAAKILEHYVCVEDVLGIACGVISATICRVLAPAIDDTFDETKEETRLMDSERRQLLGP